MTDSERLEQLFLSRHPCVAISTYEEEYALGLLREIAVGQSCDLWLWTVSRGLRDGLLAGSPSIAETDHPAAALYFIARERRRRGIFVMLDLIGHLGEERTLRMWREAVNRLAESQSQLVIIDHREDLPPVVTAMAARVRPALPEEQEIEEIVRQTLREAATERRVEVQLSRQELRTMIRNLRGLSRRQVRQVILDSVCIDHRFDGNDLQAVLTEKRRALQSDGILDYVESPVDLKEIGGLSKLKQWLERRTESLGDEAISFGIPPPRGILMLGIQGAGKSLAAKAVATAWHRPLLRLDAGALYDRYIGESERRLREALQQAEHMAPVILWIDEIEKAFASAASQSTDGGLSKRMFGALLTWMQEHTAPVFLVATANDIEALPPELLRKGRFDEIFFVGLPGLEARTEIVSIHLKKRQRDPAVFDVALIAEAADGFSGAEIEQAIIAALHDAFAARTALTTEHILQALRCSPPLSVTMGERLNAMQAWAAGRCVIAE